MPTSNTDLPVCPYCGHEHEGAWEWDFGSGLEGEWHGECGMCSEPFVAFRNVSIYYSTKKPRKK